MFSSPNPLAEPMRAAIVEALNASLADGQDFSSHLEAAHWNVRGPNFTGLHALFGRLYEVVANQVDDVAERAVTLGGVALGTVRTAALRSRLPEYPTELAGEAEHVTAITERLDVYLTGLRSTRNVAQQNGDQDTVNFLTTFVEEGEKYGWQLRATLNRDAPPPPA